MSGYYYVAYLKIAFARHRLFSKKIRSMDERVLDELECYLHANLTVCSREAMLKAREV